MMTMRGPTGPGAPSSPRSSLPLARFAWRSVSDPGVELQLESRRLEWLRGGPSPPKLRPTPNDLVGSTPAVRETAVRRLYAQAARRAACHERCAVLDEQPQ
jgi:hypothetical protein